MPPTTRAAKARGIKAAVAPTIAKTVADDKYADNVRRLEVRAVRRLAETDAPYAALPRLTHRKQTEVINNKRDIEKNERDIEENERMRAKAQLVSDPAMRAFALKMIDDTRAGCLLFRDKCLDHARRIVICIDKWKALASSD